jgi:inhibitor of KinA sporulation pathway (predicted exonuclease)
MNSEVLFDLYTDHSCRHFARSSQVSHKSVYAPYILSQRLTIVLSIQEDVDAAPPFATLVHSQFREFLARNGLINAFTGEPIVRFCWCSDGPWDIRDFVVKQCFISKVCPCELFPRHVRGVELHVYPDAHPNMVITRLHGCPTSGRAMASAKQRTQ